jgi:hypothetical protein
MSQDHPNSVQLEGEELESARKLVATSDNSLRQLASLTHTKLFQQEYGQEYGARERSVRPTAARVHFDNVRVVLIVEDELGCSVYEDPPGICRPCRPGE